MTLYRTTRVAAIGAGLIVFGMLSGVAFDQIRFDRRREALLRPYEEALTRRNQELMKLELATNGRHPAFEARWRQLVQDIDNAAQAGNPRRAVAAWREAHAEAVRSGRWPDMADVGDAALRVGAVAEFGESPQAAARRSYLTVLFRARAERSLDGVLRACQGFAFLGDRSVVQQCIRVAYEVAGTDTVARGRVIAFTGEFLPHPLVAADPEPQRAP